MNSASKTYCRQTEAAHMTMGAFMNMEIKQANSSQTINAACCPPGVSLRMRDFKKLERFSNETSHLGISQQQDHKPVSFERQKSLLLTNAFPLTKQEQGDRQTRPESSLEQLFRTQNDGFTTLARLTTASLNQTWRHTNYSRNSIRTLEARQSPEKLQTPPRKPSSRERLQRLIAHRTATSVLKKTLQANSKRHAVDRIGCYGFSQLSKPLLEPVIDKKRAIKSIAVMKN